MTALHIAASQAGESIARLLLDRHSNLEAEAFDGSTPSHAAAANGHLPLLRLFIKLKARIDAKDLRGSTALHIGTRSQHMPAVKFLLDRGADVNARDNVESTPLHIAAGKGALKIADIDAQDINGRTPAHVAAAREQGPVLQLLINSGTNLNIKGTGKCPTALFSAVLNGSLKTVELLFQKHIDVDTRNADGSTALCSAAESGHVQLSRLLLEKGADVDAEDERGRTALYFAALGKHNTVIQMLLASGADPANALRSKARDASDRSENSVEFIKIFLNNGLDRPTTVYRASNMRDEQILEFLFANGLDASDPMTALLTVAENRNLLTVQFLLGFLENNPGFLGNSRGFSPYYSGFSDYNPRFVRSRHIDFGFNRQAIRPPLVRAAERGSKAAFWFLLHAERRRLKGDRRPVGREEKWLADLIKWSAQGGFEKVIQLILENDDGFSKAERKTMNDEIEARASAAGVTA
jgi:ankyrin repeat protein